MKIHVIPHKFVDEYQTSYIKHEVTIEENEDKYEDPNDCFGNMLNEIEIIKKKLDHQL
jgi:hypothetical protein